MIRRSARLSSSLSSRLREWLLGWLPAIVLLFAAVPLAGASQPLSLERRLPEPALLEEVLEEVGLDPAAAEPPALEAARARPPAPPSQRGDGLDRNTPHDALELPEGVRLPSPPDGFNTHDAGWLRISFPPSKRHRVQPLIQDAETFREQLRDLFGFSVLDHVTVHVARTAGEMTTLAPEGSPFPKYAEGVAYPRLGLILLTIEPKHPNSAHDLAEVFRHELSHLALYEALAGQHVPLWLNEGFAIHLSGESSLARMQTLWTATLAETLMPLSQLDRGFPDDIVETPIAYAQAGDVVRHLLRTRYSQRFVAMLRRVRGGQPFAHAMTDSYGFEPYGLGSNSLEDEWRRDVAKRYSFWPVLLSGSMVWFGALGLFAVGYYRRRKEQKQTLARWAVEEAMADGQAAARAAPAPQRMHIVLAPKDAARDPAITPGFKKPTRDMDVPKVEHEGSWHTLH